jgi:hypothetical protein
MPFTPRRPAEVPPRSYAGGGAVRVAIAASTMKLNPVLFDVIARIGTAAKAEVAFHFFPLAATGLAYFELSRIARAHIPHATVHPQLPYEQYIERLAQCDLFLCPFPYGNMNSLLDTLQLGLPGVCLDGPEPHAHGDAAVFARINLPSELTTQSVDEYVAAAIRLIDDRNWRIHCTEIVRNADLGAAFFTGDAGLFCKAIEYLIWPPGT